MTLTTKASHSQFVWLGSLLQPRVLKTKAQIAEGTQLGAGLNGGATDVAHVMGRAYIDIVQAVDLSTVFASVVRALAIPTEATDMAWHARLLQLVFSESEASKIIQ